MNKEKRQQIMGCATLIMLAFLIVLLVIHIISSTRKYVVNNETAGSLSEAIDFKKLADYQNVVISGELNGTDIWLIKELLGKVTSSDLM